MTNTACALRRSLAIFGLWAILAVLTPLTWLLKKATGGSLTAAEWAKAEIKRLSGAV